ncbi:hypothetical protein EDB86DRAFT_3094033 [Lactarius hatsudake]|nr:hypothetical protein EDB86DRAFT_3094033 [Lactarius hatsudake]
MNMALPLTTTISQFLAPSSVAPSRPPSPIEDDDQCPLFNALVKLTHSLIDFQGKPPLVEADLHSFLTNSSPDFPQGIPHALGLHIMPEPLNEVLTAKAELIRALTTEVHGLTAIVHKCLPPPKATAPAPAPAKQPSAQSSPPKPPTTKPPT